MPSKELWIPLSTYEWLEHGGPCVMTECMDKDGNPVATLVPVSKFHHRPMPIPHRDVKLTEDQIRILWHMQSGLIYRDTERYTDGSGAPDKDDIEYLIGLGFLTRKNGRLEITYEGLCEGQFRAELDML